MNDDLSPSLGGGPLDWPHTKPPAIKFQPPWYKQQVRDQIALEQEIRNEITRRTFERFSIPITQPAIDHVDPPNREAGERFSRRRTSIFGGIWGA